MKIRILQIWGFLLTVLGWIFIACSLAMEGWKVTAIGGQGGSAMLTVAWYWSSLWRSCFTDSTSISNCYDFPVLWSVEHHVQIVRGLLFGGLATGMLGFILSMVGMECTYIGGKDKEKNRAIFTGSLFHIISGLLAAAGYAVYARHVSVEYFSPSFDLKFDLGAPLFLGWAGCLSQITGGLLYQVSVYKICTLGHNNSQELMVSAEDGRATNISAESKHTTNSNLSTVSELSLKSASTVSKISHNTPSTSKVNRSRR